MALHAYPEDPMMAGGVPPEMVDPSMMAAGMPPEQPMMEPMPPPGMEGTEYMEEPPIEGMPGPKLWVPAESCQGPTTVAEEDCASIGGSVYVDANNRESCFVCPGPAEACPDPPGWTPKGMDKGPGRPPKR